MIIIPIRFLFLQSSLPQAKSNRDLRFPLETLGDTEVRKRVRLGGVWVATPRSGVTTPKTYRLRAGRRGGGRLGRPFSGGAPDGAADAAAAGRRPGRRRCAPPPPPDPAGTASASPARTPTLPVLLLLLLLLRRRRRFLLLRRRRRGSPSPRKLSIGITSWRETLFRMININCLFRNSMTGQYYDSEQ